MFKKIYLLLFIVFLVGCSTTNIIEDIDDREPFDEIDINSLKDNQQDNKLKVAILLPLSGNASKIGISMLNSAELALFQNKLNNIILLPCDTKGTAFGAIDAINYAIRDGADIILGPFFTEETKAIINIAEANNLIVISFSDNQALLSKKTPNLYLFGLTPRQEIHRLISYLIDYRHMYGFSAIFPNNVYGDNVSKAFKEVIYRKDAKAVKTDFYTRNDSILKKRVQTILESHLFRDEVYRQYDKEKALAQAEGLKGEVKFKYTEEDKIYAEAFLLPDSGSDITNIAKYYASMPMKKKPILVGTSKWLNGNFYNDKNFDGALFVSPNPGPYMNFEDQYYEIFNVYPLRIGSLAYDAVTAVMESYAKAQNKKDLKLALENFQGFEGINGTFRFLTDGIVERRLAIIKINNGRYEIINYDNSKFLKY